MLQILTRQQARERSLTQYFTGNPCKRGHIAPRRTDNASCQKCAILKSKECEARDPEKWRNYQRDYRQQNHEHIRTLNRTWERNNPGKKRVYTLKRIKCVRRATPMWAHFSEIMVIYEECARITSETGVPHHVDHIVPLRSDVVCGLHCPDNLQIIPSKENIAKSNSFTL